MPTIVPNEPPSITLPYRLAIIGDSPSKDDSMTGRLFTGAPGNVLQALLTNHAIIRPGVLMANIINSTPPKHPKRPGTYYSYENYTNDGIDSTAYLREGYTALSRGLSEFEPHCCLLLGSGPIVAAGITHPISSFRGTIFQCTNSTSPLFGLKCVAGYSPSHVVRNWHDNVLLDHDIERALAQSYFPETRLPQRAIQVDLTPYQVFERLAAIQSGQTISIDIEGTVTRGITCIGIAESPLHGFVFWPCKMLGDQQTRVFRELGRVLADARIGKILQNSLYDNFALAWKWKMPIRGVVWDTMLSGWELLPEMEKGLGTLASIYTEEPYYKAERKVTDERTHSLYCGKDATVTYEIMQKHSSCMNESQKKHFQFNMSLLPALLYMEHRGIKYDKERAQETLKKVREDMSTLLTKIEAVAGRPVNPNSSAGANSLANILYKHLKYPPQYAKEAGRRTDRLTANADALLSLARHEQPGSIIYNLLEWRALEGQRKQLEIDSDPDGRVRCSYNLVGTETGRMACYESPSGSGMNMQTVMAKFRDLYRADDGYDFCKCDLSGADGWTVAAWSNYLGDSTMLDDYLFDPEFKPAKVLMLMYLNSLEPVESQVPITTMSRPDILARLHTLSTKKGWLYPACKATHHGSSYGMKPNKVSDTIKLRAWKDTSQVIYVEPKICERLQHLFIHGRYSGILKWQAHQTATLQRDRKLGCASGHVRPFLGRLTDQTTINAAWSHEPQANTTYATNRAMLNLWTDPENRRPDGTLIIEPLHQVHDELDVQWPQEVREWARAKMKSYFANDLTIAHQQIRIPFEGKFGPSWGECKTPI